MEQIRKLPIGIQTFDKLREGNFLYVDKTAMIYQIASTSTPYFLSRPRRFGKSLLLSTFEAYFQGRKDLFQGLAIEQLEKEWEEYPVLHLDLNARKYEAAADLTAMLNQYLEKWELLYGQEKKDRSPEERFAYVIEQACMQTGKQVVVLIDEYDKPLLQAVLDENLLDEYRKILKAFYGVLKSADRYLRFVFLTGVTKFAQVSVFSDLNQLNDISMDRAYNFNAGPSAMPLEVLKETELFLQHIDSEGSVFRSNHASNYLPLGGTLNRDREALIQTIDAALEQIGRQSALLRQHRLALDEVLAAVSRYELPDRAVHLVGIRSPVDDDAVGGGVAFELFEVMGQVAQRVAFDL